MVSGFVTLIALVGLASAPLLWLARQDRRRARAEALRAEVNAALFRAFAGESLVAVQIEPPSVWRAGRVILSAPSDWQELLAEAWPPVTALVPAGYELVVKPSGGARTRANVAHDLALPRAA
jgi:hypothetical protein